MFERIYLFTNATDCRTKLVLELGTLASAVQQSVAVPHHALWHQLFNSLWWFHTMRFGTRSATHRHQMRWGDAPLNTNSNDDDDELMLNVLRCHLTY